jgi:hypothetical protein
LIPVNVLDFTIPFEVGEAATSIREVELLVSKDRGKRWHSVARQPVETGKFAFRADSDGEYWFTFRTMTANGNAAPVNGQPQLRVMVNVGAPMIEMPSRQGDTGPLIPPKPERFRVGESKSPTNVNRENVNREAPTAPPQAVDFLKSSLANEVEDGSPLTNAKEPTRFLAPKLPGYVPPDPAQKRGGDLLEELMSGMSPFIDVEPVPIRAPLGTPAAAARPNPVPTANAPGSGSVADSQVGSITGITLGPPASDKPQPQIVVRWDRGQELWRDAQIDILRRDTVEGPWTPIATNLPNNGEYWWYLTPEDLKPFYVAVRIRSVHGEVRVDTTQRVIEIDPKLSSRSEP